MWVDSHHHLWDVERHPQPWLANRPMLNRVFGEDDLLSAISSTWHRRVVRHLVQNEPDPNWLLRPSVQQALRALGEIGLAYDLLVRVLKDGGALVPGGLMDAADDDVRGERSLEEPDRITRHSACAGVDYIPGGT